MRETFLQGGQIDYEGAFAHEATRTDAEGRYELPLVPSADADASEAPRVLLHGDTPAGRRHTWEGQVIRAEGALDPGTRLAHLVARVADPYGLVSGAPPLSVGLFVEAEILGPEQSEVVALPRSALRESDRVTIVDAEDRLRSRAVELLRIDGETVFVLAGLAAGERVAVRSPSAFVEGMAVRIGEALAP